MMHPSQYVAPRWHAFRASQGSLTKALLIAYLVQYLELFHVATPKDGKDADGDALQIPPRRVSAEVPELVVVLLIAEVAGLVASEIIL